MRRLCLSSSFLRTSFTSRQPASTGSPWSSRRPSCSSACKGPSRSRWRPSSGAQYFFGCNAPSKGFDRTGGRDGPQSGAGPETCTAADSDSGARSGSCCGGWGPASQPLLAPPQRRGGCADTPTSTPFPPPCARAPANMDYGHRVGPLGTPGPPQVCSRRARRPDALRWFLRVVGSRPPTETLRR